MGAVFLLVTAWAFSAGHVVAGYALGVAAFDQDQDGDLDPAAVTVTQQPGHGTATVNKLGGIVYTPAANYSGSDSLTYQVCDTHQGCDTATVTLTVKPVPDGPVISTSTSSGAT